MRVITGTARGRKLKELPGRETRPTTDKVKESIFNIIQFDIEGRNTLDLFAGTGQLGIAALSRGAARCAFVDARREAAALVRENLAHCGLADRARVVQGDALAFLTDIADGYIARRFNMVTRLGRILDPLADKLMTFTVIVCITVAGIIPVWAVVIFFIKEAAMGLGAVSMLGKIDDVIPANWLGKSSTFVFFVVCAALVLFPSIPETWATVMISAALVLTIAAFLDYLRQYLVITGKKKTK